jgi:dienelactone hydrolase
MQMRFWTLALVATATLAGTGAQADVAFTATEITIASTSNGKPQDLPATPMKPDGSGPFSAVVIMHDCSGRGPRSSGAPRRWAERLAPQGYVVLIPDSFAPRGFPDGVCLVSAGSGPELRATLPFARAVDAVAARDYLRRLPYVDAAHIGIMGGSHGGSTTLATLVDAVNPLAPPGAAAAPGFAAGIALYPGCGARYGAWNVERAERDRGPITRYIGVYKPVAPLLILIGEKDDWTPAEPCQTLADRAQAAGYPVTIKIYPGAYHSFDSNAPPRYVDGRRNANKPEGHGATTGGDAAAWADSVTQMSAFFGRYLKVAAAKN